MRVAEKDSANLLELIHKRRKHSSTIFCSQYLEEDWNQKLGGKDNPLTDAIMDRISFDSYKIPIMSYDPEKDISMREGLWTGSISGAIAYRRLRRSGIIKQVSDRTKKQVGDSS